MYWANKDQTPETKSKRNTGAKEGNKPKIEDWDWEHKLVVGKYLESYKTYKEGTKTWEENRGKCYYPVLQHCPPELKIKLKSLGLLGGGRDKYRHRVPASYRVGHHVQQKGAGIEYPGSH